MQILFHQIAEVLSDSICINPNPDIKIRHFMSIEEATDRAASWISGTDKRAQQRAKNTKAQVIIVADGFPTDAINLGHKTLFMTKNPRLAFGRLIRTFYKPKPYGIHPTAIIHPEAKISEHIYIGPYSVIGRASLGNNTVIHGHCFVYDDAIIGNRVTLHAHTCIGSEGFGFDLNEHGIYEKFPHIGTCEISDDVEIFPFANIDRGALGNVYVGRGTKLDHYVHVSHNCSVGENTIIAGGTILSGSVKIGDNAWVGVQSTLKEHCAVGDNALVGSHSLVTKNVPSGEVWAGVPAKFIRKRE